MDKLTISRKEWLRGEGARTSYLLRPRDGKMCCLGIYARACGVPVDKLEMRRRPADLFYSDSRVLPGWTQTDKEALGQFFSANDDERISEADREQRITELFAAQGVTVEFTD